MPSFSWAKVHLFFREIPLSTFRGIGLLFYADVLDFFIVFFHVFRFLSFLGFLILLKVVFPLSSLLICYKYKEKGSSAKNLGSVGRVIQQFLSSEVSFSPNSPQN